MSVAVRANYRRAFSSTDTVGCEDDAGRGLQRTATDTVALHAQPALVVGFRFSGRPCEGTALGRLLDPSKLLVDLALHTLRDLRISLGMRTRSTRATSAC